MYYLRFIKASKGLFFIIDDYRFGSMYILSRSCTPFIFCVVAELLDRFTGSGIPRKYVSPIDVFRKVWWEFGGLSQNLL
jgi:hypothetical protein